MGPKPKPAQSTLIQYYIEGGAGGGGWYTGYLVRRGRKWVRIRRILPYRAKPRSRGKLSEFLKVRVEETREVGP